MASFTKYPFLRYHTRWSHGSSSWIYVDLIDVQESSLSDFLDHVVHSQYDHSEHYRGVRYAYVSRPSYEVAKGWLKMQEHAVDYHTKVLGRYLSLVKSYTRADILKEQKTKKRLEKAKENRRNRILAKIRKSQKTASK